MPKTGGIQDEPGNDGGSEPAGDSESQSLTVYSGREEEYVAPLFEIYEEQTDSELEVRYGDSAELASTILEEADDKEPNDEALAATPLSDGVTESGAVGAQGDVDWFAIDVPATGVNSNRRRCVSSGSAGISSPDAPTSSDARTL